MVRYIFILTILVAVTSQSNGQDAELKYQALVGEYQLYGGGLSDPVPPTSRDKKIAFELTGKTAKDIFEAIGPDIKDKCTEGQDIRFRAKDNGRITCTKAKKSGYICYFGFNLQTGKSIGGVAC